MLKKILLAVAAFIATMGFAFAQVDVNKADQAALDGVKGIGPVMSKRIIDERAKNGNFKDWADLEKRVKGIGDKSSDNLSKAGLTVGGQAKSNAPMSKEAKADAKSTAKAAAPVAKPEAKSEMKDAKPAAKEEKASGKADAKKDAKEVKKDDKAAAKETKADTKKDMKDAKEDKASAKADAKKSAKEE
ncbi:MAG: helix-hairpin-helix domain-containing protein, partial [Proteobacteria bacterium]|nr:helix-hairpin-helix domain-containing protein [Pseudomonadota bacterium]